MRQEPLIIWMMNGIRYLWQDKEKTLEAMKALAPELGL